jgi:DNA polymerase III epsilon subunit-like protein
MKTYPSMVHANGSLVCSVDLETTGTCAGYHEIVQIAVVPLDNDLRPSQDKRLRPFYHNLKPNHPERASRQAMSKNRLDMESLLLHAPDAGKVADLLREWFEAFDLPQTKRLMPLAHNWAFESGFLNDWLGEDEKGAIFHAHSRCSMSAAILINDLAVNCGEPIPFTSVSLESVSNKLKVENLNPHDSLSDSICGAEVYRRELRLIRELTL